MKNKVTLQSGQYFIGDPCYAIPHDFDREYWGDALNTSGYFSKQGVYHINGFPFIGYYTYYGDGSYLGTDGHHYSVDSGLIGAVSMEFVKSIIFNYDYLHLGTVVDFSEPFECYATDDGKIHIGHIMIDTNPSEEGDL
jgi:hypothetical protein